MMDVRALKVGQHVTLSGALPEAGTIGEVVDVAKWHVSVLVAARIADVDGAYYIEFDYDNNVYRFFTWAVLKHVGIIDYATWCPMPLKIIGIKEPTAEDAA
jgi:hypothetical protein